MRPNARHKPDLSVWGRKADGVAAAYDQAGKDYLTYADGDPGHLFSFDNAHAYPDRRVWSAIDFTLNSLRCAGKTSIRILDAGCGPGTWLRRVVARAHNLGFEHIAARGFDISETQIRNARRLASELSQDSNVELTFELGDLTDPLLEPASSVDLTLCLYSVLNHLPVTALPRLADELARVTCGHFIATVRSAGSPPTISIDSIEKASHFEMDHQRDLLYIELRNGQQITLPFHLFTAEQLRDCFKRHFRIDDLYGLDLFHNRFGLDRRWNPDRAQFDKDFLDQLARMEEAYAKVPSFIDRASHLLLIGSRQTADDAVQGSGRVSSPKFASPFYMSFL